MINVSVEHQQKNIYISSVIIVDTRYSIFQCLQIKKITSTVPVPTSNVDYQTRAGKEPISLNFCNDHNVLLIKAQKLDKLPISANINCRILFYN